MNLRTLKKLSKRAAPLLPLLGDLREQFRAGPHRNYHKCYIGDLKHWERSGCHPTYQAGPTGWLNVGRTHEIVWNTRAGRRIVMRPPCHPREGTIMVGETGLTDLLITRGALVVGPYRYVLTRDLNCAGRSAAIIMVNPSTADAEEDDQTIRKLYGFASRNGISRFAVVNKFAFRATDIDELRGVADPVGPENDLWIEKTIADSEMCILAWGRLGKLPPELRRRWRYVVAIVAKVGRPALCLGTTDDRQPIHPLTLGYGNALRSWEPPA